jgi:sucrose phosphorylase
VQAFTEQSALLITYGDMIAAPTGSGPASAGSGPASAGSSPARAGSSPARAASVDAPSALGRLAGFLDERTAGLFSHVHILPFCPYSSDDGFSVKDYRVVDPALGSWDDVQAVGRERKLVFDLVLNHASAQGEWFRQFLAGIAPYDHFFLTRPLDYDASTVTRPRTHPLITPYTMHDGRTLGLWTTFSADQIDLDFTEPVVLAEFLDIMLDYASRGARMLRLDAIAYLWKTDGTACIHRPETHAVVKLFRAVLEAMHVDMAILTETNVPHEENMSYFGNQDEAHIVYNFSLPPLTLHAFASGDAGPLSRWAAALRVPAGGTLLNFLASHDGIGVTPAKGLVDGFEDTIAAVEQRGGRVSYKAMPGGPVPYELNISWMDAVAPPDATDDERVAALAASHAVAFAMDGVPAVYFHSLVGSRCWLAGPELLGYNRAINRQRPPVDSLLMELDDPRSLRCRAFAAIANLLKARSQRPAFAPQAPRLVHSSAGPVFALERGSGTQRILVMVNCGRTAVRYTIPGQWRQAQHLWNPCAGTAESFSLANGWIDLTGFAVRWLEY